jgi:carbamoyl-phosphate synthase small subunit
MTDALLVLEDGSLYRGRAFGAEGESVGEVVFNTSMTGYQEIISDPSYAGQMVVMTYPHIGNYGINPDDFESRRPFLEGLIVKEYCDRPSNWRATSSLGDYLKEKGIVGIEGIDTRAVTRKIRERGAMQGALSSRGVDPEALIEKVRSSPGLVGRDLVARVTCKEPYDWTEGPEGPLTLPENAPEVIVYDFGVKRNILRSLVASGCRVKVMPAATPAEKVLSLRPRGVLLSNGPGDPEAVVYAIENVRKLIGRLPIFGICLGHQILGLAFGGKTFKLKFGHHGGNQPVMDLRTRAVQVTSQNHGFAVDAESLEKEIVLTHVNLNDRTVEGMRHRTLPIFSVQYHPEAAPGPHDANYLFREFVEALK